MRWSTELEQIHDLVDSNFFKKNKQRIIDINKFLPLAFIENPKEKKLYRLRRMNMDLCTEAELNDLADTTVLDNLADYQTTRGSRGNYQNALITQRKEWKDNTSEEKKQSFLSKVVKGKRKTENVENLMEE